MNADEVEIGMELEAMEAMNPDRAARAPRRWLPAVVRRRLDAGGGSAGGLFEVQMIHGHAGPVARYAHELRPASEAMDPGPGLPCWTQEDWERNVRIGIASAFKERDDNFVEVEKALRAACRAEEATDPLAGARRRTDENLRRAFGG
jgi:hypothetical protein